MKYQHKDPTNHCFWNAPCLGPQNHHHVGSLCLYDITPYHIIPYYNLPCCLYVSQPYEPYTIGNLHIYTYILYHPPNRAGWVARARGTGWVARRSELGARGPPPGARKRARRGPTQRARECRNPTQRAPGPDTENGGRAPGRDTEIKKESFLKNHPALPSMLK